LGNGERDVDDGTPKLEDGKSALDHQKNAPKEHFCPYHGNEDELDADGKPKLIKFKAATYKNLKEALEELGPISEKSETEQYFIWTGSHNTASAKDLISLAPPKPSPKAASPATGPHDTTVPDLATGIGIGVGIGIGLHGGFGHGDDHGGRRGD
jgi:hypothetical protein